MPDSVINITNMLITSLGAIYLLIVAMRLLLQFVRADFYNPLSQFIVKATNPLLLPLRKIITGFYGVDWASICLLLTIHVLLTLLLCLLNNVAVNFVALLCWSLIGVLFFIVNIFFWAMMISIVVSFVAPQNNHPALLLMRQLTEPLFEPIRRRLPSMGGLDFSPIIIFIGIYVIEQILYVLAGMARITPYIAKSIIGI
jgi:YggT family protein